MGDAMTVEKNHLDEKGPQVDLTGFLDRPSAVTWLFSGDSITQGGVHTRGWRDYTQLFRERLLELGRGEDVTINTSVGGSVLAGTRVDERVLRFKPDVLLVMFGTNDSVSGDEGLEGFRQRYVELIRQTREAGITVVPQTIVPMMPVEPQAYIEMTPHWADEKLREYKLRALHMRRKWLSSYAQAVREAAQAAGVPVVDHWEAWLKTAGLRGQLMADAIHPNEYGHRLLAHTIFRTCGMWSDASATCRLFVPV
jgi:lysophospholipase L1-like esterase